MRAAPALLLAALLAACGGKVPPTRYYQLAAPPPAAAPVVAAADAAPKPATPSAPAGDAQAGPLLVLEPLAADEAYQDERIVYRTGPYRLDYYQYHLWSAPPGVMVADYLEQALERSGRFRAVVRELTHGAPVVLGGRLVALEEVDESRTRWIGRVVLELTLRDAETSAVLWSAQLTETEPLTVQSPEGLAAALSKAMARIAARVIPEIAAHAQRVAATSASPPQAQRGMRSKLPRNARATR